MREQTAEVRLNGPPWGAPAQRDGTGTVALPAAASVRARTAVRLRRDRLARGATPGTRTAPALGRLHSPGRRAVDERRPPTSWAATRRAVRRDGEGGVPVARAGRAQRRALRAADPSGGAALHAATSIPPPRGRGGVGVPPRHPGVGAGRSGAWSQVIGPRTGADGGEGRASRGAATTSCAWACTWAARRSRFAWVVLDGAAGAGPRRADGAAPRRRGGGERRRRLREACGEQRRARRPRRRARRPLRRHGYPRATTPDIDAIARKASSSITRSRPRSTRWARCRPSGRRSIPTATTARSRSRRRLPKDRLTLAELLSAQGVYTAGFAANAVAAASRLRPRVRRVPRGLARGRQRRPTPSDGDAGWLAAHGDKRFFAYVHFREPHLPVRSRPPFDTRFGPDAPIAKESAARRDAGSPT